jgi:Domian of unknown function (DUF4952)
MWNAQLFWLVKIRLIYFVKKLFWPLKLLIMIGILWPTGGQSFSLATHPNVSQADCAKSSKVWRQPPKEFKLSSCQVESGQLEILVLRYAVKGVDAAKVEKMLRQRFGMGKLRFVCCGWEPQNKNGHYKDKDGYNYRIAMYSSETLERNWHKIPEFEVVVSKFLTEP